MREYSRSSGKVNGYFSFEYYGDWFLYRNGTTGCWMVASSEEQIKSNKGVLRTKSAAELPTQNGLKWP